ncbi:hypothetical protein GQ457_06G010720 [Hibiscus cannabinus]
MEEVWDAISSSNSLKVLGPDELNMGRVSSGQIRNVKQVLRLGIPLGHRRNSSALWDPMVCRFYKRLASWKTSNLSLSGKLVLIRSVLSSLPLYYMSIFRMPTKISWKLNSIMANFLWGGGADRKKIIWVHWRALCAPLASGGLGILDLAFQNRALFCKWSDVWLGTSSLKAIFPESLPSFVTKLEK